MRLRTSLTIGCRSGSASFHSSTNALWYSTARSSLASDSCSSPTVTERVCSSVRFVDHILVLPHHLLGSCWIVSVGVEQGREGDGRSVAGMGSSGCRMSPRWSLRNAAERSSRNSRSRKAHRRMARLEAAHERHLPQCEPIKPFARRVGQGVELKGLTPGRRPGPPYSRVGLETPCRWRATS